ncbi:MAG: hypothetical protein EXR51_01980 [Dehalococcoidia bacterium]|nr:hypothetical protein [Dehalococcoidia bacterium]
MNARPAFADLPLIEGTTERHAWDVWGPGDDLGMLNLLTPERVRRAAGLVGRGRVFNIEPSRAVPHPNRPAETPYQHHTHVHRGGRSDTADAFELHGGVGHLDSLRHIRYREFGYYGGRQEADLDATPALGIQRWAEHGVVGRGVLLDVAGHLARRGAPLAPYRRFAITGELLDAVAAAQGVAFEEGDMMLLRTGWMDWYLGMTPEQRAPLAGTVHNRESGLECPGLDAGQGTAAWLWDRGFSVLLADNIALEAMRVEGTEFQHRRILAMLGMGIGELFTFAELAEDCARDGVYEFMVTVKPLSIPGGVGSPANAYVIK